MTRLTTTRTTTPTPTPAPAPAGTIDCESAMRRLWEYLDAALPEPDMAAVRAHAAGCESCREHVEFERWLLAAIRASRRGARARPPAS